MKATTVTKLNRANTCAASCRPSAPFVPIYRQPQTNVAPSAATRGGDGAGETAPAPPPAAAGGCQRQRPRRREFMLYSAVPLLALGDFFNSVDGGTDGRTIVNSVLGAYGLPKMKATPGFRYFDDMDTPCTFEYPRAWVRRRNTLRPGVIISDFDTADKICLEVFPEPRSNPSVPADATRLAEAAVLKLINPAVEIGGDSRLELPPKTRIKTEQREVEGKLYTYVSFPSETVTRSGYQVRRKNVAVVATRRGTSYVLGCSARSDQFNAAKAELFEQIVDSFRIL